MCSKPAYTCCATGSKAFAAKTDMRPGGAWNRSGLIRTEISLRMGGGLPSCGLRGSERLLRHSAAARRARLECR